MKKSKLLCLGLAAMIVFSGLPQTAVQTYGETVEDVAAKEITEKVPENSTQEDGAEETVVEAESLAEENGFNIEDGVLLKYSGNATEVVIPDGVTSIGSLAFSGCSGLTSITIPSGVTSIGGSAFHGCSGLTSITIPSGVTSIEPLAFHECSGLTSITIPDSVTSIGARAFYGCSGLTSITIPSGVTNIEYDLFHGCSSLTSITIPSGVTSIGESVFSGCSKLASISVGSGNSTFDSREDCNAIIDTKSNTLLYGCKNTRIPNSVTSIGEYAFYECSGLTSITIPNSVTSIGSDAFLRCSGLTSITIPDSVTSIGERAFSKCSSLRSITIPERVTSIGGYAFRDCSSLTSITIPDSVTSIENGAFYGCSGLRSITIPDSVTSIGGYAFDGCSSLTSITIPDSVTSIEEGAFDGCSSLTGITIPDSVTSIGGYAFYGCSSLTSITIPDSVTGIGEYVFSDCSKLASISVGSGNSIFDSRENCNAIIDTKSNTLLYGCKNTTIPSSVTSIGDYVFVFIDNLTIRGTTNSYAETYAKEKNIPFESIDVLTKALSDCQISIPSASAVYNGKAQTVTVTIKDGTYTLKEGTDYTVAYSNNTNAGTATVTITGKGKYTGTAAGNFTIQKGIQSLSAAKNTYDKAYGNGAFNLGVKREAGDGALTYKTSDKKVADVDATGKVTIKGTGSATITVSAAASANYNASSELKITVNVSPAKQAVKSLKLAKGRKLTVSWKKDTKAAGYEIQYSTDKKFKKSAKKTTVKSNKTTSKTLTKLTAGKKYYVRVRAYKTAKVNGKNTKLYGAWSSVKTSKRIKK